MKKTTHTVLPPRRAALFFALILSAAMFAGCISDEKQTAISQLWTAELEGYVEAPPIVVQGGVCVVTSEYVYLFSEEGDLRWSIPYEEGMNNEIISDGAFLFMAHGDAVEKRSCETGEIIWQQNIDDPYFWGRHPCLFEDRLYFSLSGQLACMDSETGEIIWQEDFPENEHGCFSTLIPLGDVLLTDTFNYQVLVIDSATGAVLDLWDEYCMGYMVVHEGLVYALGGGGVICLDGTGTVQWIRDLGYYRYILVPPAVSYPYLFMVMWENSRGDDNVTCVDMRTGKIAWTAPARYGASEPPSFVDNPACIATTGSLFIAESPTDPGRILVRDVATGKLLDSLQTDHTAMDFATDGTLLYCVSGEEDDPLACYDLGGI